MKTIRLRDAREDGRELTRLRGRVLARAWGEWLGRIPWDRFATLTFDPKRVFPVSREVASREAVWWLGFIAHVCRRPVGWACAVERGRSGLWHAHAVLVGAGRPNWKTIEAVWQMRNGQAVVKPVDSMTGIALYTTKSASDGEVVISDTMTPQRFENLASKVVVPLARGE